MVVFSLTRGTSTVNIRFGAITSPIKVDKFLAVVLREIETYNVYNVEVSATLLYRGYGVDVGVQINKENMENVTDIVEIEGGRDVKSMMRGLRSKCFRCRKRAHLKKDSQEFTERMHLRRDEKNEKQFGTPRDSRAMEETKKETKRRRLL